eukprot:362446-Chlamydomonas_euryale.AAC.4
MHKLLNTSLGLFCTDFQIWRMIGGRLTCSAASGWLLLPEPGPSAPSSPLHPHCSLFYMLVLLQWPNNMHACEPACPRAYWGPRALSACRVASCLRRPLHAGWTQVAYPKRRPVAAKAAKAGAAGKDAHMKAVGDERGCGRS